MVPDIFQETPRIVKAETRQSRPWETVSYERYVESYFTLLNATIENSI